VRIEPLGDAAALVVLGEGTGGEILQQVLGLAQGLEASRAEGIEDIVPAYNTIAVFYDPLRLGKGGRPPFDEVCSWVEARAASAGSRDKFPGGRRVEIPVCYGGRSGPDLPEVAAGAGLSEADAVALHSGADYRVHAIGFVPGFPYLGGLPERLATPRRATPRPRVPAGSVGIGGSQTGVYPFATPGGWHLIGRTPLVLFDPARGEPALLRAGDTVRFRPISEGEFAKWK